MTAERADSGEIERVLVFRALMLGDMLCAVPALRALRAGLPGARIALVGLPWAAGLAGRLSCVDEFFALPAVPGLPESSGGSEDLSGFLERLRARRFDLAIQMHGSGGVSNPLVRAFGARRTVGFCEGRPQTDDPAWQGAAWPARGNEIERLLQLVDALGLPRQGTGLEFPLNDEDRTAAAALLPALRERRPYVCVHAGAQLASRRWPAQRFAAVADALMDSGRLVVLTGGLSEAPLVAAVRSAMRNRPVDLAGRTSLGTLGALIEGAERVVCNDTGISHLAAALRRPSVVVSSGGDVERWAPLDHALHRVLWRDTDCRPCSHSVCPTLHECAHGVTVMQVLEALESQSLKLREPARATPRPELSRERPFGILNRV